jgi:hypothetical protein
MKSGRNKPLLTATLFGPVAQRSGEYSGHVPSSGLSGPGSITALLALNSSLRPATKFHESALCGCRVLLDGGPFHIFHRSELAPIAAISGRAVRGQLDDGIHRFQKLAVVAHHDRA